MVRLSPHPMIVEPEEIVRAATSAECAVVRVWDRVRCAAGLARRATRLEAADLELEVETGSCGAAPRLDGAPGRVGTDLLARR